MECREIEKRRVKQGKTDSQIDTETETEKDRD